MLLIAPEAGRRFFLDEHAMAGYPELIVRPLHGEPHRFALDKERVTIGRSQQNDLVLRDQWLSRQHAEIRRENGMFFICDRNSRNGTMVNGVRISDKVPLQNNDVITLGDETLTFVHETSGSVILSETSNELELEGTVVVPTEQLLAATQGQEDTWDNLRGPIRERERLAEDPAQIIKQNQILTALSQASMALISDRPVNELLEFILELAFKSVRAERGFVMLTQGDGKDLEVKAVRSSSAKRPADESITFSRSIAEKVVGEKVSILTSNAMTDPRFRSQDSIVSYGIRSAMSAPLWNNQKVTGLIYVDSLVHENVFTEDDLSLLTSLANVAAIKLENARLLEHMIEKKRMEHELELAGEIQQNLLPRESPKLAGWDIAGSNDPCYTIGGDYFDFIERPAGRRAFALGDVSGKGAAAALMMMVLRATVHSLAQQDATVASIISRTNRVMFHNSPEQSYVTFFLGDLDPESGHLQYITAGHIPPILYHGQTGELERLECGGTVLGLFETASFEEGQAELRPGDVLIVFTDGISESWGEDEEEFGDTRLIELMRKHATCSAQELLDRVLQEVDRHAKGNHPSDDRTLIVIKRGKPL